MFTVCYSDDDARHGWTAHRKFRTLAAAVKVAAEQYGERTIVVGGGGRILVGNAR